MARTSARALLMPCALAGLLIGTAGCTSPHAVTKSDLESEISQKLTGPRGNKPESVSCPEDLKAKVGAKVECEMTVKGETYNVIVVVTSIDGDQAKFDMNVEGQPTTSSSP